MKRKQSTLSAFVGAAASAEYSSSKKLQTDKTKEKNDFASSPLILFAPGAGAPSSHLWMKQWAERLSTIGVVELMDYAYTKNGKKAPDPHAKLVSAHREALSAAVTKHSTSGKHSIVLAGKSMGSRMGCHVAVDEAEEKVQRVAALICFGYPLVGQNGSKRDEVLLALQVPILFIQGTRDALCPLKELEGVRAKMKAPNELHIVETADHSLTVLKKHVKSQAQVDAEILEVVKKFMAKYVK